jgi:hypothetical protein
MKMVKARCFPDRKTFKEKDREKEYLSRDYNMDAPMSLFSFFPERNKNANRAMMQ